MGNYGGGPFNPIQTGKAAGWLRLAVSSQSGGEWTPSIVDVLNAGNPMVQITDDEVKIAKHGMDRWSFRKMGSKSK